MGTRMSRYTEIAMQLRSDTARHCNCAQTILIALAEVAGITEEEAAKLGSNFGGGMKCGSTCGAITSAAMIFGLAGMDDVKTLNSFYNMMKQNHDGVLDCASLLRNNAAKGGEKKAHCDAMICESIGHIEEILKEKNLMKE